MCGIAGLFKRHPQTTPDDIGTGSDADGLYHEARVVLGHRQLAIIDLSAAARQPLSNADGTVWISYHGEIYNYREPRTELMARGPIFLWMKQHAGTLEAIALGPDGLDRSVVGRLWRAFQDGRLYWSLAWALVVLGAQG
jgi:hypothetical protein